VIPLDWQNEAVRSGIARMLQARSAALRLGERPIGWKLAFGAPAFLERFGLTGPVIGFLTDAGLRPDGSEVPTIGWTRAVAEPEIAAHIGEDVDDLADIEGAVSALGPAIELADIDTPPEDIGAALAGNVYHRAVVLGEADRGRAGAAVDGLTGRVSRDGEVVAEIDDLEALTGPFLDILRHTGALLQAAGETFRAGEVVILGSVVPPLDVEPGEQIQFEVTSMSPISVRV
jgi:2-keto-4-pentenoate hydratase